MTTTLPKLVPTFVIAGMFALTPLAVSGQESDKESPDRLESRDQKFEDKVENLAGKWEKWAESQAVDWENWAESFGGNWEEWAKNHEASWERWAEDYAGAWEKWGEQVQSGEINEEELNKLLKENLDMLGDMPLGELYGQIMKSTEQLKDMPFDNMQGMEELVRESVERALSGLEDVSAEAGKRYSKEWSKDVGSVVELLEQLQGGLDKKRDQLDKFADDELSQLKSRLADMPNSVKAQKDLLKGIQKQLEDKVDRNLKDGGKKAKYLDELQRKIKESKNEQIKELARKIAKERRSKSRVDKELEALRAEIKQLRAELKRVRGQKASRDQT